METLQEIIRSIAAIILFAGFLEMLLPDTEMRRYIQVIVGLFVIVSLVTPMVKLVDKEKSFEVASWQYIPKDDTKELIDKGQKIAEIQKQEINNESEQRLASQINALAKLHEGIEDAKAEIIKATESTPEKLKIMLTPDKDISEEDKIELTKQVLETVTAFFDYSAENIEIGFVGRDTNGLE